MVNKQRGKKKRSMYIHIKRSYNTAQESSRNPLLGFRLSVFWFANNASVVGQNVPRHGLVSPGIRACVANFAVCSGACDLAYVASSRLPAGYRDPQYQSMWPRHCCSPAFRSCFAAISPARPPSCTPQFRLDARLSASDQDVVHGDVD
jgi:hypothetical protein